MLAGAALVLLAGIYFTSSNGNNRIRLTWQDSRLACQYGNFGAPWRSWLLTVGVPAALLFRRFKKDALFWSALVILTLTYFIYIGSVGGYNEFLLQGLQRQLLLPGSPIHPHLHGTGGEPGGAGAPVRLLPAPGLPSLSVFAKAAPTLALTKPARLANMQREWKGHLHHPEHPWTRPFGEPEKAEPSGTSISRRRANPRKGRGAGRLFHRNSAPPRP
ncbi:MAG: hypothetical protein V8Q16_05600 [Akkermansia muciniphila]